jgi:hypothetical protein
VKKLLLTTAIVLGLCAPAFAQSVNFVPQVGTINAIVKQNTYSASGVLMVPAASATDLICLNGSTSKNVSLKEIIVSGSAGTAITTPILVNLNHSLDTGGTANTGLALPVAVPLVTTNPAATATLTSYSANPTVNDATPNLLAVFSPTFAVTTTAQPITIFPGSTAIDWFAQGFDILKAGTVVQQICLNLDGKTISTGLINVTMIWTEN